MLLRGQDLERSTFQVFSMLLLLRDLAIFELGLMALIDDLILFAVYSFLINRNTQILKNYENNTKNKKILLFFIIFIRIHKSFFLRVCYKRIN